MCIPYEKTISGRAGNAMWKGMGYTSEPDPFGKLFKIGQMKTPKDTTTNASPRISSAPRSSDSVVLAQTSRVRIGK